MLKKGPIAGITVASIMTACASDPDNIEAAYVSPLQYQSYNCDQIEMEFQRVSARVASVTGHQRDEANKDAVATGVGIVLFWPALFFLIGDDKEDELARLKGEYEALEKVAIQKECTIADEIQEQREEQQRKQEERRQEEQQDYPA